MNSVTKGEKLKKRLLAGVAAVALCVSVMAACVGCGNRNSGGTADTNKSETTVIQTVTSPLKFNSKYYTDMEGTAEERGYYTFSENGTGKCYYYYFFQYKDTLEIENYTISFKYTYTNADKTQIACFYDGVSYTAKDNQKDARADWSRIFDVSEDVLISMSQYGRYVAAVNEEYLKQIPNYGKKA